MLRRLSGTVLCFCCLLLVRKDSAAFLLQPSNNNHYLPPRTYSGTRLFSKRNQSFQQTAGELKKELESQGVSSWTSSERRELLEALEQVLAEEHYRHEMAQLMNMKASELRQELEELGISTKNFLEKSEFVKALAKAHVDMEELEAAAKRNGQHQHQEFTVKEEEEEEGQYSAEDNNGYTKNYAEYAETTNGYRHHEGQNSVPSPKEQHLQEEMEHCKAMKTPELRTALEELGISTKSFFEKSELIKALALAHIEMEETQATAAQEQEELLEYNQVDEASLPEYDEPVNGRQEEDFDEEYYDESADGSDESEFYVEHPDPVNGFHEGELQAGGDYEPVNGYNEEELQAAEDYDPVNGYHVAEEYEEDGETLNGGVQPDPQEELFEPVNGNSHQEEFEPANGIGHEELLEAFLEAVETNAKEEIYADECANWDSDEHGVMDACVVEEYHERGVGHDEVISETEQGYWEYKSAEFLTDDFIGPRPKQPEPVEEDPFLDNPFASGGYYHTMGGSFGIADMLNKKQQQRNGVKYQDFSAGASTFGIADPFAKSKSGASTFGGARVSAAASNNGEPNPFGASPFEINSNKGRNNRRASPFINHNGTNPFNGMGDVGEKAKEMMKNPKFVAILKKAKDNPRLLKAVYECIRNPAMTAKYQSDPEFGKTMRELRSCMQVGSNFSFV